MFKGILIGLAWGGIVSGILSLVLLLAAVRPDDLRPVPSMPALPGEPGAAVEEAGPEVAAADAEPSSSGPAQAVPLPARSEFDRPPVEQPVELQPVTNEAPAPATPPGLAAPALPEAGGEAPGEVPDRPDTLAAL
ncbi:hypothetical protein HKCCE3408_19360, partial [Rhodobacterales bacterium HKCCE3408]|nr:hypothetical protein [Rhodobacterales bacterium HKCCE3408]